MLCTSDLTQSSSSLTNLITGADDAAYAISAAAASQEIQAEKRILSAGASDDGHSKHNLSSPNSRLTVC